VNAIAVQQTKSIGDSSTFVRFTILNRAAKSPAQVLFTAAGEIPWMHLDGKVYILTVGAVVRVLRDRNPLFSMSTFKTVLKLKTEQLKNGGCVDVAAILQAIVDEQSRCFSPGSCDRIAVETPESSEMGNPTCLSELRHLLKLLCSE